MKNLSKEIKINKSKFKFLLSIGGLIPLIFGAIEFILKPNLESGGWGINALGFLVVTFFGGLVIWAIYKFLKKPEGLVINQEGIINLVDKYNLGLIKWADIESINFPKEMNSQKIVVMISNAKEYIKNRNKDIPKRLIDFNIKKYGTPIIIHTDKLSQKKTEVKKILDAEFEKYNAGKP